MYIGLRALLLACVLLATAATAGYAADRCDVQALASHFSVPVEIVEQSSISEIEQMNLKKIEVDGREEDVPFGHINYLWEELKALYKEGDCLAFFNSAPETWKALAGVRGYLLARDGTPIYAVITMLN